MNSHYLLLEDDEAQNESKENFLQNNSIPPFPPASPSTSDIRIQQLLNRAINQNILRIEEKEHKLQEVKGVANDNYKRRCDELCSLTGISCLASFTFLFIGGILYGISQSGLNKIDNKISLLLANYTQISNGTSCEQLEPILFFPNSDQYDFCKTWSDAKGKGILQVCIEMLFQLCDYYNEKHLDDADKALIYGALSLSLFCMLMMLIAYIKNNYFKETRVTVYTPTADFEQEALALNVPMENVSFRTFNNILNHNIELVTLDLTDQKNETHAVSELMQYFQNNPLFPQELVKLIGEYLIPVQDEREEKKEQAIIEVIDDEKEIKVSRNFRI